MDATLKERLTRLWEQNDVLKEAEGLYLELEANKKPLLAALTIAAEGKSHADREAQALSSVEYKSLLTALVQAEKQFNFEKRKFGILENAFFAAHSTFKLDDRSIRKQGA